MTSASSFSFSMSLVAKQLMAEYGLSAKAFEHFVATAPFRYKEHTIEKKNGSGVRYIANPTADLKVLQRWIVRNYLVALPVHDAAHAYEVNTSIRKNAQAHAQQKYLLKLDFHHFFPSIKPNDLIDVLKKNAVSLSEDDFRILVRLLFWKPRRSNGLELSIGAPSSPKISNLVMYSFDKAIFGYCQAANITYTRFADDLTFSTNAPSILQSCLNHVVRTLQEMPTPSLKLNEKKTVFSSKKFNRRVTGLVITNQGTVSLGRDRKREIRASIHHFATGKLDAKKSGKLRGMLAYAHAVEPDFLVRMCDVYGEEVIKQIKQFSTPHIYVERNAE